jgi:hypothetical protein
MIAAVRTLHRLVVALAVASALAGVRAPVASASPVGVVAFRAAGAPPAVAAARDAMAAEARRARVGWIDLTTPAQPVPTTAQTVRRGVEAYDGLRFDEAVAQLDRAAAEAAATGAAGLAAAALSDLFLYRGLARQQAGDETGAWDDLVAAATIDGERVLDPVRFPPRAIEAFDRARAALAARPRWELAVDAPAPCAVEIDGAARRHATLAAGGHYVSVRCPDSVAWGERVMVDAARVVSPRLTALARPGDDEILVQARVVGGDAIIVDIVEVAGTRLARLRRLGVDGRELARASVGLDPPASAAGALAALLVGPAPSRRWTRSPWLWAGAGALVATAVLVPILLAQGGDQVDATVRPSGLPW